MSPDQRVAFWMLLSFLGFQHGCVDERCYWGAR
jgi:hypothetical protein